MFRTTKQMTRSGLETAGSYHNRARTKLETRAKEKDRYGLDVLWTRPPTAEHEERDPRELET